MNLNQLNNKKVGILGLGIENLALIKYLLKHKIRCQITVCDARLEIKNKLPVLWQLGKKFKQDLDKFDILFRSPGWPIDCPGIREALKAGVGLYSPMKLFFALSPAKNIIGVTGTKGKVRTASPGVAVVTNFYSEHLAPADPNNPNYHKSLKDYRGAKMNIIKYQKLGDKTVLNYESSV